MLYVLNFKKGERILFISFIWIFNAPSIENETVYTEIIEKTRNAHIPDHLKDPELLE